MYPRQREYFLRPYQAGGCGGGSGEVATAEVIPMHPAPGKMVRQVRRVDPAFFGILTWLLAFGIFAAGLALVMRNTLEHERALFWEDGVHCGFEASQQGADRSNYPEIALQIRSEEQTKVDAEEKIERAIR